jgi:protein-tyrosine kinase
MTRLHGALQRATDGKAPILPPGTEAVAGTGTDASQPTFSVPWALDGEGDPAPGSRPEPTAAATARDSQTGLVSRVAKRSTASNRSGVEEKLVGWKAAEGQASFSAAVEQYRKLAGALHYAQAERGLKAIVVTSANPGEGKSLTASNLALTLSQSFQRQVLLIDGDLRRPSLHELFGVSNVAGLSDGLLRSATPKLTVHELSPRLSILPSGPPTEDPTGKLTSDQLRQVLEEARARYDWVIFDTPPIGVASDARLLSEIADGVVLVVEAGKTGYPDLLRAVETIGRERVIGVVLNRVRHISGGNYYYSNYYSNNPQRPAAPKTIARRLWERIVKRRSGL